MSVLALALALTKVISTHKIAVRRASATRNHETDTSMPDILIEIHQIARPRVEGWLHLISRTEL